MAIRDDNNKKKSANHSGRAPEGVGAWVGGDQLGTAIARGDGPLRAWSQRGASSEGVGGRRRLGLGGCGLGRRVTLWSKL